MSWRGWTTLIFALWLIVAAIIIPFIPNNSSSVTNGNNSAATNTTATANNNTNVFTLTNFVLVGIIFAAIAIFMFGSSITTASIILISGIWLIVAAFIPSITSSSAAGLTNGLIFGILVTIFSFFDRKKA